MSRFLRGATPEKPSELSGAISKAMPARDSAHRQASAKPSPGGKVQCTYAGFPPERDSAASQLWKKRRNELLFQPTHVRRLVLYPDARGHQGKGPASPTRSATKANTTQDLVEPFAGEVQTHRHEHPSPRTRHRSVDHHQDVVVDVGPAAPARRTRRRRRPGAHRRAPGAR